MNKLYGRALECYVATNLAWYIVGRFWPDITQLPAILLAIFFAIILLFTLFPFLDGVCTAIERLSKDE